MVYHAELLFTIGPEEIGIPTTLAERAVAIADPGIEQQDLSLLAQWNCAEVGKADLDCQTTIRMAYRRQLGWRIFAFSRNRL